MSVRNVAMEVRRLILEHAPAAAAAGGEGAAALADDLVIVGPAGLGFDSVRAVELVFACEERLAVRLGDTLFDGPPLTVGRLTEAVRGAKPASR